MPFVADHGKNRVDCARSSSVIELSRYTLEALRKDEEFILYRGRSEGDASQILVLSPVAEYPTPESLKRLEHECSLREALNPAWSARPIAMARHLDRTVLDLEDPGGMPLLINCSVIHWT